MPITIASARTAEYVPEVWSKSILEATHDNLVLVPTMNREYEAFSRGTDTIHVPTLDEIAATLSTDQPASVTFSTGTGSVTNISLNQWVYNAVKIDEQVLLQSYVPVMQMYTKELGRSIADKIDETLAADNTNGIDSFTQVVGTDNIDVTLDNIFRALQYLDDGKAPGTERVFVCSPATFNSLLQIEVLTSSLYKGGGDLIRSGAKGLGFKGEILGSLDVYVTTNLEAGASGKKNGLYQKKAIAFVMQADIETTFREPHDEFTTAVRARALFGFKVMRNVFGVEVDGK